MRDPDILFAPRAKPSTSPRNAPAVLDRVKDSSGFGSNEHGIGSRWLHRCEVVPGSALEMSVVSLGSLSVALPRGSLDVCPAADIRVGLCPALDTIGCRGRRAFTLRLTSPPWSRSPASVLWPKSPTPGRESSAYYE
jgi:hypothetical protein